MSQYTSSSSAMRIVDQDESPYGPAVQRYDYIRKNYEARRRLVQSGSSVNRQSRQNRVRANSRQANLGSTSPPFQQPAPTNFSLNPESQPKVLWQSKYDRTARFEQPSSIGFDISRNGSSEYYDKPPSFNAAEESGEYGLTMNRFISDYVNQTDPIIVFTDKRFRKNNTSSHSTLPSYVELRRQLHEML